MIEQGIHVSARDELFGRGDGGLTLTFLINELKDAAKKERQQAFATFLNDLPFNYNSSSSGISLYTAVF